jgi:hypothetical protein
MGIDPDSTICTFGTNNNRSFIIHFYDVINENALLSTAFPSRCNQTKGSCRKKLSNDTVLNLGQTSGRTIFNVDWNRQLLENHNGYYIDANIHLEYDYERISSIIPLKLPTINNIPTLNNLSYIRNEKVANQFTLERQDYHRWEYALWNGTHENVITGPRIVFRPESGTHVTGTAFQTEYTWHHVIISYDSTMKEAKLVVDNQELIDLFYVTSDYELSLKNVNYAGSIETTISVGSDTGSDFATYDWSNAPLISATRFLIENINIYNRILPKNEISEHYYSMLDATFGQDQCTPCQAGEDCQKSLTSDHIVVPKPCATGKYRNQASTLVQCTKCPEGRYSLKRGLKHYSECQLCPEGLVCEIEGANNLEYRDQYCFDEDVLSVECQASLCPEDSVCGMGTKKETMLNIKCPPGYYCTHGTCTNGM